MEFAECGICDFACPLGFQGAKANRTQTIQEKSDFEKMRKLRMLEIKMPELLPRICEKSPRFASPTDVSAQLSPFVAKVDGSILKGSDGNGPIKACENHLILRMLRMSVLFREVSAGP